MYPKRASVIVPTDPWNDKAKAYAEMANSANSKIDSKHKTDLPPYSSSRRYVYRRLCNSEQEEESALEDMTKAKIGHVDNASNKTFIDNWLKAFPALRSLLS